MTELRSAADTTSPGTPVDVERLVSDVVELVTAIETGDAWEHIRSMARRVKQQVTPSETEASVK